jgi:hypothetical protein
MSPFTQIVVCALLTGIFVALISIASSRAGGC